MRSIYINHEINCLLYDKHFIQEVKRKFEEDLERSLLLSFEHADLFIIDRGKEWIGTILAFFL